MGVPVEKHFEQGSAHSVFIINELCCASQYHRVDVVVVALDVDVVVVASAVKQHNH